MFLQLHHRLEPLPSYRLEMLPSTASEDVDDAIVSRTYNSTSAVTNPDSIVSMEIACPSCGHQFSDQRRGGGQQAKIWLQPGLPAGVKFDPTDAQLLEHLAWKARREREGDGKCRPLIDEFIPTLEGENGICCTHPEKLPGVSTDGQIRHFFHRPSRAYTTGNRKRRKVDSDDGGETRWHKTGKTRSIVLDGMVKGQKKILVLYTNYGKPRKPEKTNWIMHQYHLGPDDDEKDGEFVVSKVFYQTQPRQTGSIAVKNSNLLTLVPKDCYPDLSSAPMHIDGEVHAQRQQTF